MVKSCLLKIHIKGYGSTGSSFSLESAPFRATFALFLSWRLQIVNGNTSQEGKCDALRSSGCKVEQEVVLILRVIYLPETACGTF